MANGGAQEAIVVKEQKEPDEMPEEAFLKDLYLYMKKRDTPIERVPHLGFKQIDLFLMNKTVKDLGGYHQVTTHQLWKQVYNTLGGNPRSTSAATCTRRHYEKLLLPYECYLKGGQLRAVLPAQKRPPGDGLLQEGGVQRPLKRRLLPSTPHHQAPPSIAESHLRVFSLPVHYPRYYHPSYPVLSPYVPMPPSLQGPPPGPPPAVPRAPTPPSPPPPPPPPPPPVSPPPPAVPQPQVSYLSPSRQRPIETAKQPLEHLRYLAEQYKSSTGLTEPLNLSVRAPRVEARESPASSFAPPSANKNPKFLNKPSPLYPARQERDQGSPPCVKQDPDDAHYLGSPPPYPLGAREDLVLNLKTVPGTCASGSPPASLAHPQRTPPGVRAPRGSPKADGSPNPAWDERAESEQSLRRDVLDLGARLSFLKREQADGGKREIQIPLSVLHGWIKLISSSSSPAGKLFPGSRDATTTTTAMCTDSGVSPFDLRTRRDHPSNKDPREGSPRQKDPTPNHTPTSLMGHNIPYQPIPGYLQHLALSSAFLKDVYGTMTPGGGPPRDFHRTPEALSRDPHGQGLPFPLGLGGSWSPPAARQDFQGSSQRVAQTSMDITSSPGEEDVVGKGMTMNNPSSSSSSPPLLQLTSEEIMKLKRIISCSP